MSRPKLSIITPSFNQARFIEQALLSVQGQGVPVEHIVIDGGSTDGTVDILRRHSQKLAYWHSRPDKGQTDALNQGLAVASGEIIGWINSDDFYLPGAVTSALRAFNSAGRPDVVHGYTVIVGEHGAPLRECRHDDFSLRAAIRIGMDLTQQAMFWRRDLNAHVLPLDESLRFCMDLQLVTRFATAGARFERVPEFWGAFRIHGQSKTSTIADVCSAERARVLSDVAGEERVGRSRSRAMAWRRLRFVKRGEWRYALLGGRVGLSRDAKRGVAGAARWARDAQIFSAQVE